MTEKLSAALLPPTSGQVITIPKDIQQLTIKDATIFIGKEHAHRSMPAWCRCLMALGVVLAFAMGAVIITPTFRQFTTIVLVSQTADSHNNPLPDRSTTGNQNRQLQQQLPE
ncbi:unnamed protein product [Didymodactylos carnosus]|uniref:Uncharacterized protein n=1 Tax=Didymodactylos carnosus TaxID=1234261 RepID=A0A815RGJ8_9BILA|nr:unnamed protein product [Didymodactylos carnosus]CAF1476518.1 unnamed protein product [Didymodactylos carnosus]CAF4183046.1 unnamed protein product [Didymodactylos carnosus]CAF4342491.1 unnamed protein product [Didymodactylos carnosus]